MKLKSECRSDSLPRLSLSANLASITLQNLFRFSKTLKKNETANPNSELSNLKLYLKAQALHTNPTPLNTEP